MTSIAAATQGSITLEYPQSPDSPPLLIINDKRSVFERLISYIQAALRAIQNFYHVFKYGALFDQYPETFPYLDEKVTIPTDITEFTLFVHGLKGTPIEWGNYIQKMKTDHSESFILSPHIIDRGNCSLEKAAQPLLELVQFILQKCSNIKRLNLLGTSNGGRIIAYIENHLKAENLKDKELNCVSLVGVHYGTKLMTLAQKCGIAKLLGFHRDVVKELSWKSDCAKQQLQEWQEKQIEWQKEGITVRHFLATADGDEQVIPHSSSLPILPNAEYRIYPGYSHLSILKGATGDVFQWLYPQQANSL